MIVRCERCQTRFRLDASRLPPGGARVRCSRCRHAFHLRPEDALARDADASQGESRVWDESGSVLGMDAPHAGETAAASPEAAPHGGETAAAAPEAGADSDADPDSPFGTGLFEDDEPRDPGASAKGASSKPAAPAPGPAAATPPDSAESDWEFDTDLPIGEAGRNEPDPHADGKPADGGGLGLDDLGDPESWDVVAGVDGPPEEGALPPQEAMPAAGEPEPPRAPAFDDPAPPPPAALADPEPVAPSTPAPGRRIPSVGEALGWIATCALLVIAAHGGLRVQMEATAARPGHASWASFAMESVTVRRVESLHGPTLVVVRGQLVNPGPQTRTVEAGLGLRLVGPDGAPLAEAPAALGAPLPPGFVRTAPPAVVAEAVARRAADLAGARLGPAARVPFEAVFPSAPSGAVRVQAVELDVPPAPPVPQAVPSTGAGAQPGGS